MYIYCILYINEEIREKGHGYTIPKNKSLTNSLWYQSQAEKYPISKLWEMELHQNVLLLSPNHPITYICQRVPGSYHRG